MLLLWIRTSWKQHPILNKHNILNSFVCLLLLGAPSYGSETCAELYRKKSDKITTERLPIEPFRPGKIPQNKREFFRMLADAIDARREQITKILLRFNNVPGTELEFDIVRRQLREEIEIEMYNFEHTPPLKNIAVYASTNVPLYTLVAHGLISKAIAQNIWFRTPETTRQVYVDLLAEIKKGMPSGDLEGLNLLTEGRDVQYENFNKMYVMGMNKRGIRIERQPSEMVVFTGNPLTAKRLIDGNLKKIKEMSQRLQMEPFKQVFLGFGAGINPIVIPGSAKYNLPQVIYQSMESIRINNGQDCMAADFFAVHGDVLDSYSQGLLKEIKSLKPGLNIDPLAGYTPLTMAKNFSSLINYRDKYSNYLLNKDAVINQDKKIVSPHIFLFPYNMFREVELQEHFGPFISIFRYDNEDQLRTFSRDERVQEKAMYVTILGDNQARQDMDRAINIFRQTRHHVLVNNTLFDDVHPNMPFGGKGPSASMIVNIDYRPERGIKISSGHRPKLLSFEAALAFGEPTVEHFPPLMSRSEIMSEFTQFLQLTDLEPFSLDYEVTAWKKLKNPFLGTRPQGLKKIRQIIAKEGLFIFDEAASSTPFTSEQFFQLYGVRPIGSPNLNNNMIPGVILHPSDTDRGADALNRGPRGSINPHLGWGNLHGLLDSSKYIEYIVAEAIQPGIMAYTESYNTLKRHQILSQQFLSAKESLLMELNTLIKRNKVSTAAERSELENRLTAILETFFIDLRKRFPEGAYIKNYGDFGTADLGTQITTFTTPPRAIAAEFLRRFERAIKIAGRNTVFTSDYFQRLMSENIWELGTAFYNRLLVRPQKILVQSRVNIAKTEMGFPMEFRVDFIDGEPIFSRARFGTEYMPDETKQAGEILKQFFLKAPEPLKYTAGGADVALLADGNWVIIEFNFGSASGTMNPHYFPVESNLAISFLQGKKTPFITNLDTVFIGGLGAQIAELKKLNHIRPLFWKGNGLADLSVAEVGRYFRDRHLENWALNPSKESGEQVLATIRSLFDDSKWRDQEDIQNLIVSSENFVARKLLSTNIKKIK